MVDSISAERFFVNSEGVFLGIFVGHTKQEVVGQDENDEPLFESTYVPATPPDGGIEVFSCPEDGRQKYNFNTKKFGDLPPPPVEDAT